MSTIFERFLKSMSKLMPNSLLPKSLGCFYEREFGFCFDFDFETTMSALFDLPVFVYPGCFRTGCRRMVLQIDSTGLAIMSRNDYRGQGTHFQFKGLCEFFSKFFCKFFPSFRQFFQVLRVAGTCLDLLGCVGIGLDEFGRARKILEKSATKLQLNRE